MRIVGMLGVLACSCGPSSAIEVVVEMPDGDPNLVVDEVRLYVGLGDALNERKDSNGNLLADVLVPRGYGPTDPVPKGFFWKRDVPSSPDQDRAPLDGDEVHFTFQPGTDDRITVIAVGYHAGAPTAAAALEDAEMEPGAVRQYHVILAPASAPLPASVAGPVTVQEWGADPDARDCVHYKDPDHSLYVVLNGDRDCDGRIEQDDPARNECRIGVFDGYRRPGRASLSCVTVDNIGTAPAACVLGGAGCMEVPNGKSCPLPGNTCVDADVCQHCGTSGTTDSMECVAELATNQSVPRLDCTFGYTRTPTFAACPGPATFQNGERFSRSTLACDPNQDYLFYLQGSGKWAPAFPAQGFMFTGTKPSNACELQLTATAMVPAAPTTIETITGVVSAGLVNGRAIAIPMSISFEEKTACDGVKNICVFSNVTTQIPAALAGCLARTVPDPW